MISLTLQGSCDNGTRIWKHTDQTGWQEEQLKGPGHTGNSTLHILAARLSWYSVCLICVYSFPLHSFILMSEFFFECAIYETIVLSYLHNHIRVFL